MLQKISKKSFLVCVFLPKTLFAMQCSFYPLAVGLVKVLKQWGLGLRENGVAIHEHFVRERKSRIILVGLLCNLSLNTSPE
jgi:hypothetical protein